MSYILALDQGTTSSRAILYDKDATPVMTAQEEFPQIYPADGWVEHDPEAIWKTVLSTTRDVLGFANTENKKSVKAIGITNQRETCVVWERATGKPIYNAIVWQDRRTAEECAVLKDADHENMVTEKTGLLLDPYFSATKIAWILDNVDGARARAEKGELAFGTIDTFLIWRLTDGASHVTDATNASRTSLYNIETGTWDDELLALFNVPRALLPDVLDCAADFGVTSKEVLGVEIPITGVAGDQQAAAIGQGCFAVGDIKSTYGTGCFVLLNTGTNKVTSANRLLTTVAYRLDGVSHYALEGSIFVAGAAVQWLRDEMGLIKSASETEAIAQTMDSNNGLYLVPAFTGLGAPHWDPNARGGIFGITRATGPKDFVRAALESVCYQTHDLLAAMKADGAKPNSLKVDGGMAANNWTMQFLSDILDIKVNRPSNMETTALGAALLAGHHCRFYGDVREFSSETDKRFLPNMKDGERQSLLIDWNKAVGRILA
ncbi:glycerol kinase GlpK [bacterium AH-315-J23]|nr:glycerol kinase GlpK [bacterium AH-315-J23]PHQ66572.1 MAG: glycerol kinase [Robiginitomaculum sp.]